MQSGHLHPNIWQQFCANPSTAASQRYNWPEWHKNRELYCFWGILIDDPALNIALDSIIQPLRPYLLTDNRKQPHLTLYASGFLVTQARYWDDTDNTALDRQEARIRELELSPFSVQTGRINSFAAAPFIEIDDPTHALLTTHQQLSSAFGQDRDSDFIPHLTLGLYSDDWPSQHIADTLCRLQLPTQPLLCTELHLLAYHAHDIRSPLLSLRTITLE